MGVNNRFATDLSQQRLNKVDEMLRVDAMDCSALSDAFGLSIQSVQGILSHLERKGHITLSHKEGGRKFYKSECSFKMNLKGIKARNIRNGDRFRLTAPEIVPFRDPWVFCLHVPVEELPAESGHCTCC